MLTPMYKYEYLKLLNNVDYWGEMRHKKRHKKAQYHTEVLVFFKATVLCVNASLFCQNFTEIESVTEVFEEREEKRGCVLKT